jgi:integrase
MQTKAPTLWLHKGSGQWATRWAGRTYYFGTDRAAANHSFLHPDSPKEGSLRAWMNHQAAKALARPVRKGTAITVAELSIRFIDQQPDGTRRAAYYATALRRFVHTFGRMPVHAIDEEAIASFATTLRQIISDHSGERLSDKSIRHELTAIKSMWRWGMSPAQGRICPVLALDTIKTPRVRKGEPEDLPIERIRAMIGGVERGGHLQLGIWLRINYLAALRPSEVVRLAHGQGKLKTIPRDELHAAIPDGMCVLRDHKTSESTQKDRIIPLSPQALEIYRQLAPLPLLRRSGKTSSLHYLQSRYARLCADAGVPGLPHRLRDSAATHLLADGVDPATVDLVLGHEPRGELGRYARPSMRLLRERVSRIAL